MTERIAVVDFDGTIAEFSYPNIGKPKPGVKESLQKLKDIGFEIHILSCRTSIDVKKYPIDRQEQVRKMEQYLDEHEIPYDKVLNKDKPLALWYIDDRAIEFRDNWDDVVRKITEHEE